MTTYFEGRALNCGENEGFCIPLVEGYRKSAKLFGGASVGK